MKTIQDLNISKKRVLVRFDLNVPLNEMGEITNEKRINAALPTILSIIENNGRLVILSHLGRPLGQVTKGLSPVSYTHLTLPTTD